MFNILDNLTTMKREQLIFLQKAIETVNSALTIQKISTLEVQKIIFDISLEELAINTDEVRSLRGNLNELLEEGDKAVHYLMAKLNDYQARYFASSFLGWFGKSANIAIPKLIDLASGHSSAAGAAQKAILFIGEAQEKILHAVEEALNLEDDESFRNLSNLAVKTDLKSSDVFFEVLRRGALHESPHIREAVADIIWHLRVSDIEKIKSILMSLSVDESQAVRGAALTALDLL
jgi:hypothetical protein